MLRLRSLHRSNGAYYLTTTQAGGADRNGLVEPDGRWLGSLAEHLAIGDAVVDRAGLSAAFRGRHPIGGQPLDPQHGRVSVAAIDCVFAAPKSVSVLHALAPEEVTAIVCDAHHRAVEGALGFLERNAAFVRRRGNAISATGFLAAAFLHRTSRAADPHLHTHLLLANLGADDGERWSAIDTRPIYAHAGVAGCLYRAGLRRAISDRLEISWERRAEGFADLIGIPKAALRGFSQRSGEIAAELEEAHQWSRRAKEVAADRTRRVKQLDVGYESLVREWRERALDLGLARSAVTRLATPARGGRRGARAHDAEASRAVEASIASFDRPFTRGELLRATTARLDDGAAADEVERAIDVEIDKAALVRASARVAYLSHGRFGRFPSGVVEARYMTREVAALVCERDRSLGMLARSETVLDAKTARAFEHGGLVLSPTTAGYEFVRAAAMSAERDGRRIVAFAASRVGAAHLEAVTGIAAEPWKIASSLADGTFVVVDDPISTPVRDTADIVEFASSGRIAAVFFDRRANTPPIERHPSLAGGSGSLERFDVEGVRVVVVSNLARLAEETRRLARFSTASDHEPHVVSARPASITDLVGHAIDPARLGRALERDPRAEVIAVGGAAVLSRSINGVSDTSRTHLVVAAVGSGRGGRAEALGVAEPSGLRRSLGRFPLGSRERALWIARGEARGRTRTPEKTRSFDRDLHDRSPDRRRSSGRDL